jgi:hypothetical protein
MPESVKFVGSLKVFQMFRLFHLTAYWNQLNFIVAILRKTFQKNVYFLLLLYLFIFAYTILGMDLYAYKVAFDDNNEPIEDAFSDIDNPLGQSPQWNFDTFLQANISVFVMLANDGWSVIFFDCYRTVGPITSVLYFLSCMILGQYILLQLFLTILLDEFNS